MDSLTNIDYERQALASIMEGNLFPARAGMNLKLDNVHKIVYYRRI